MTPLELAVILSAVDNASRVINRVQEKLEDLAKAGERMMAIGGVTTFAGGLIRAAGDAFRLSEATFSAMSFQDESARVNPVFPPTAAGLKNLGEIQAFAISQSQRYAYAAMQFAESVYMGLWSFLSAQQAMAATPVPEQVVIGTHGQLAEVMRTLGRLYLNFADKAKPAHIEFQRLGDVMTTLQTQSAFKDVGEITSALQYATAAAQPFHLPLNTALAAIALGKLDDAQRVQTSTGAPVRAQQVAESTASGRYQILKNNFEAVAEKLAEQVLPAMTHWFESLTGATQAAAEFLSRHQTLTAGLVDTAAGLGILTVGPGAFLLTVGPILIAGGQALKPFGKLGSALRLATSDYQMMALRALYAWEALQKGVGALSTFGLAAALTGPTGVAVMDVIRHFDSIKNFFGDAVEWMKTTGLNIMNSLGDGVLASIEHSFNAAWDLAKKIGVLFHFHSPPIGGPLRYAILNFHLGEELAEHPRIAPAVELAQAISRPLIAPPMHVLTRSAAGLRAAPGMAAVGARTQITINYAPVINAVASDEWVKSARRHADELVRIIEDKLIRRARLEFA